MPLVIYDKDDLKATLYCLLTLRIGHLHLCCSLDPEWAGRMILFKQGERSAPRAWRPAILWHIATLGGEVTLAAWLMNFRGAHASAEYSAMPSSAQSSRLPSRPRHVDRSFSIRHGGPCISCPHSRRFKSFTDFLGIAVTTCIGAVLIIYVFDYVTSTESRAYIPTERWEMSGFIKDFKEGRINTSIILLERWVSEGPLRWVIGLGSSKLRLMSQS